jgi:STE24 endopeptidase
MTTLDPERQKQAKEYARIGRRLWLVDTIASTLYAILWLVLGWSVATRNWLTGFTTNDWLVVPLFAAIFGGIYFILDLPLSYYGGFILPHRFDQSNQSLHDWILDQVKGMLISLPIGLVILEGLYAFLRAFPDTWWLWAGGALLIFQVILVNLAPVLIAPLFNKYIPLGEEHADLEARLLKLAERANTKVRGVYKFDLSRRTKSANAALSGIGNTRRIILGDTLINEFTPDEIETVLAHELGHHVHKDIILLISFGTLITLVGFFLASLGMNWAVVTFGFKGVADPAAMPVLMLFLTAYSLIVMPLQNAVSRWREHLADEYALQSTGKSEAFASAFTRLANQNLGEIDPERWVVILFYSHPPLGERIALAQKWNKPITG